jgi:vacuolar-type H+-ATPase subunit H
VLISHNFTGLYEPKVKFYVVSPKDTGFSSSPDFDFESSIRNSYSPQYSQTDPKYAASMWTFSRTLKAMSTTGIVSPDNKRARFESALDTGEVLAEVQQLEQASHEMDEDFQKLILKHKERESAFYMSLNDNALGFIADVKKESEIILQDAEKEAESIVAVAVEESKKLKDEQNAFVQDAEKKAETILAGAVADTKKWEADKQKWEAEKTALAGVQHFEPIVKLNVGGVRYITSLTTLCRFPDTMMGCMFSGRHTLPQGEDGYFFIDRDGKHFRHILNFLRSPESYKVGVTGAEEKELRHECEYYCLDELMFPPGIEKSLVYYKITGHRQPSLITVRVDNKGVHTILDSGEKIEYCSHCHCAIFNIGAQKYFLNAFNFESPSAAAQPLVQGTCPRCSLFPPSFVH